MVTQKANKDAAFEPPACTRTVCAVISRRVPSSAVPCGSDVPTGAKVRIKSCVSVEMSAMCFFCNS